MSARHTAAILFDALGTLVALESPAPHLRAELGARFGVRLSGAQAERAIAAEIAYYRSNLDHGRDPESLAVLRGRCAEVLRGALPRSRELAAVPTRALSEALLASLRFSAFSDAHPALRAARSHGVRLIVVSNWDASLHEVLERLELTPLVDAVLSSAEAGARKPSPAIFALALEKAGTSAGQTIHVGDSMREDVVGARAAGIKGILVRRDGGAGPAGVPTISSLRELPACRF